MLRSAFLATVLIAGSMTHAMAVTQQFHATMNGKSEVPPTNGAGKGTAAVSLDSATKTLNYTVTFDHLTGPATAAHFHGPADKKSNAGVVVPIGGADPSSPITGSATLTDEQIKDLRAGKWYVNVHTAANKGGEIRGQVLHGALKTSAGKSAPAAAKQKQG